MPAIRKAIARNGQVATDSSGGIPPVDGGVTGVGGGVFGVGVGGVGGGVFGVGVGVGGGVGGVGGGVGGVIEPPFEFVQRSSHGTMPLPFLFNIFFTTPQTLLSCTS